jgi:hypothetical protein
MPISTSFSLQISLGCSSDDEILEALNKHFNHQLPCNDATSSSSIFVASSISVQLFIDQQLQRTVTPSAASHSPSCPADVSYLAVLVPPTLTESAFQATARSGPYQLHQLQQIVTWIPPSDRDKLIRDVFDRIHPSFVDEKYQKFAIKGIVFNAKRNMVGDDSNWPADIVLVEDSQRRQLNDADKVMELTNGQSFIEDPDAVIKVLPIKTLSFYSSAATHQKHDNHHEHPGHQYEIPTCPVCIHRIDPLRIGLPKPGNHYLCSKFCCPTLLPGVSPAISSSFSDVRLLCSKQRLLQPWSSPAFCVACHVLQDYWKDIRLMSDGVAAEVNISDHAGNLYCHCCAMQETLWVCLTCGFVGCGRYSNKHAEEHFKATRHVFSLELATLRIWDYASGEFAHRGDILDCPSLYLFRQAGRVGDRHTTIQSHSWQVPASSSHESEHSQTSFASRPFSALIGEEYEALLQSALEDQAQHYEGEITRLRAALTAEEVDESSLTRDELEEVAELRTFISRMRDEINRVGRQLLDAQAQEAGHRAMSQRLLREQQVSQGLLDRIHQEAEREHASGKRQVDELEQQIADLTANLQMRDRFSQNQELSNAQIMGATTTAQAKSKKGKTKLRRLFRK